MFLGRVFSRERRKLVDNRSSGSSIQSDSAHIEPSNTQRKVKTSTYISAADFNCDSTSSSLHNSIRFVYELVDEFCVNLIQLELLKLHFIRL